MSAFVWQFLIAFSFQIVFGLVSGFVSFQGEVALSRRLPLSEFLIAILCTLYSMMAVQLLGLDLNPGTVILVSAGIFLMFVGFGRLSALIRAISGELVAIGFWATMAVGFLMFGLIEKNTLGYFSAAALCVFIIVIIAMWGARKSAHSG